MRPASPGLLRTMLGQIQFTCEHETPLHLRPLELRGRERPGHEGVGWECRCGLVYAAPRRERTDGTITRNTPPPGFSGLALAFSCHRILLRARNTRTPAVHTAPAYIFYSSMVRTTL